MSNSSAALSGEGPPELRVYGYANQSYTDTITGDIWGKPEQSQAGTTGWEIVSVGGQGEDKKFMPRDGSGQTADQNEEFIQNVLYHGIVPDSINPEFTKEFRDVIGVPTINVVTDYGAVPDFINENLPYTDNSPAFQKAVDENPYANIIIPSQGTGKYGMKSTWFLNCAANDPQSGGVAHGFLGKIYGMPLVEGYLAKPVLYFTNHGLPLDPTNSPQFKCGIVSAKPATNFMGGIIQDIHIVAPRFGCALELVNTQIVTCLRVSMEGGRHHVVGSANFSPQFIDCLHWPSNTSGFVSDYRFMSLQNTGRGKSPWDWNDNIRIVRCRFANSASRVLNIWDMGSGTTLGTRLIQNNHHGVADGQPAMYYGGSRCSLTINGNCWEAIRRPIITPAGHYVTGPIPLSEEKLVSSYLIYLASGVDPVPWSEEDYNSQRHVNYESVKVTDSVFSIISNGNAAPRAKVIYSIGKLIGGTALLGPDVSKSLLAANADNYLEQVGYNNSFFIYNRASQITVEEQVVNLQNVIVEGIPQLGDYLQISFIDPDGNIISSTNLVYGTDFDGSTISAVADSLAAAINLAGAGLETEASVISGSTSATIQVVGREPTPEQMAEAQAIADQISEDRQGYIIDRPSNMPVRDYGTLIAYGARDGKWQTDLPVKLVTPTTPPASVYLAPKLLQSDGSLQSETDNAYFPNQVITGEGSVVTLKSARDVMQKAGGIVIRADRPFLTKTVTNSSPGLCRRPDTSDFNIGSSSFTISLLDKKSSIASLGASNSFTLMEKVNAGRGYRFSIQNNNLALALGNGTNMTTLVYTSTATLSSLNLSVLDIHSWIVTYNSETSTVDFYVNGLKLGNTVNAATASGQNNDVSAQTYLYYSVTSPLNITCECYKFSFANLPITDAQAKEIALYGGSIREAIGSSSGNIIADPSANTYFTSTTNWGAPVGSNYTLTQNTGAGTITITAPGGGFGSTGSPRLAINTRILGGELEIGQTYEVEIDVDAMPAWGNSWWELAANNGQNLSDVAEVYGSLKIQGTGTKIFRFKMLQDLTTNISIRAMKEGSIVVTTLTLSRFEIRKIGAYAELNFDQGIGGTVTDYIADHDFTLMEGSEWSHPEYVGYATADISTSGGSYTLPSNHRIKEFIPRITDEWSIGSTVDIGISGNTTKYAAGIDVTGSEGWRDAVASLDATPVEALTDIIFTVNGAPSDGEAVFYMDLEQLEVD